TAARTPPLFPYTPLSPSLLFAVALVFGALNAVIRPILFILTLPFFILTLGLFTFVLNAIMLWLTAATSDLFCLRFHVDGFGAALDRKRTRLNSSHVKTSY